MIQLRIHNPPPPINNESCLTGKVNGLPNYSSTCFFNSVLQALASITPFIRYLERIVYIENELEGVGVGMNMSSLGFFSKKKEPLSRLLLEVLMYINCQDGGDRSRIHTKIRQILDRVASENVQFKSYRSHHSKEQQDAQELLQALIAIIVEESRLEEDGDDDEEDSDGNRVSSTKVDGGELPERQQLGDSSLFSLDELYVDDESTRGIELPLADTLIIEEEPLSPVARDPLLPNRVPSDSGKEEKKEDHEVASNETPNNTIIDCNPKHASAAAAESKQCNLSQSMQMMIKNLSSKTPSPLSGFMGSRLECCECHHVRPIHDSPFLEIPVVPTAISKPMKMASCGSCSLDQCLQEFTEVERVHGVNCRSCSIQAELKDLQEEIDMLQEAMDSILARGCDESETLALQEEWKIIRDRFDFLESIDPDEDVDMDDEGVNSTDPQKSIPEPRKVDHEKRLMVTRLPPVLCLHVKRLHFNPATDHMAKSTQHIDFQEYLDLRHLYAGGGENEDEVCGSEDVKVRVGVGEDASLRKYRLMSVIEHRGNAFSGHYLTYRRVVDQTLNCVNPSTGRPSTADWAVVSDERISYISWNDVRQCNAYMLIYEAI